MHHSGGSDGGAMRDERLEAMADGALALAQVEAILAAPDVTEIWTLLLDAFRAAGFDRALYGLARFVGARAIADADDVLVLSNHSPAYLEGFVGGGLYRDAPMVNWLRDNTGVQSWRLLQARIASGALSPAEMRVVEFNRRHAVTAGYSIGFPDLAGRGRAGLGVCMAPGATQEDAEAVWASHGRALHVLAQIGHLRIATLADLELGRRLSPRQREVLEWVAEGKTVQDIATILGLTVATVEKHLRLARAALRVETTAQAAVKASFLNQIYRRQVRATFQ